MKNLILNYKIFSTLILIVSLVGSVYSQTIISSVNVGNNATLFSNQITKNSNATEINLQVTENWFSAKNYLELSNSSNYFRKMLLLNEKVVENDMEIEAWMLNDAKWKFKKKSIQKDHSELRDVEDWMLDENFWKIPDETDQIELEEWMTDNKFWVMVN
ncbi:MAG: hypothetical protein KOO66_05020 [Bacteroidales bacterium]|nr:hypothetical protein [Bacteroidales bacterium]